MSIPVKLEAFEGPMDLLLHLIDKNKVNIYDIPISEITDQYMEYIRELPEENLDLMSEFLVMAATLLDIKARMLLPPDPTDSEELTDPREELVQKLLEYKMYKYMSYELLDMQEDASFHLYHEKDLPEEVEHYRAPVDMEELLTGVTLPGLYSVFQDILKRQELRVDPVRSKFGTIEKEEIDFEKTHKAVETYIRKNGRCTFRGLLTRKKGKAYLIAAFLTILDLMKEGLIEVSQDHTFEEIYITSV